jgi:ribosomal protein S18 acetylase RimI-like enzyme
MLHRAFRELSGALQSLVSRRFGHLVNAVRRATLDDIELLLPLVRGYREFYEQQHDASRERAFIEDQLKNGTSIVFLAFDEAGSAIGFTQLFPTFSTVHLSPAFVLEDIFVAPDARRTGIATKLLEAAVRFACQSDASGMFLETAMDNTTAQRVYERNGWTREARFFKYNAPLGCE